MPKLILIKHSLPIVDSSTASVNWQLGSEGIERCDRLADALQLHLPALLISSKEPKAQATAAHLAQRWQLPNTPTPGLEEHHRRTAPFLGEEAFQATIRRFFANPSELVFGEETADQAYTRFATALTALFSAHPSRNIMVVTHGTVMTLYLSRLIGFEPFSFWAQLGLPSFVVVERTTQSIESITTNIT